MKFPFGRHSGRPEQLSQRAHLPELSRKFDNGPVAAVGFPPVEPDPANRRQWLLETICGQQLDNRVITPQLVEDNCPKNILFDVNGTLNELMARNGARIVATEKTLRALGELYPGVSIQTREDNVDRVPVVDVGDLSFQAQLAYGPVSQELKGLLAKKYGITVDEKPFGELSGESRSALVRQARREALTKAKRLEEAGLDSRQAYDLGQLVRDLRQQEAQNITIQQSRLPAVVAQGLHEISNPVDQTLWEASIKLTDALSDLAARVVIDHFKREDRSA